MIYQRKYTLTQPPTCPKKWDHLIMRVVNEYSVT